MVYMISTGFKWLVGGQLMVDDGLWLMADDRW